MKKIKLITLGAALIMLVLAACDNSDLPSDKLIEGTYSGTITDIDDLGKSYLDTENDATAEVTILGNRIVQIHLYDDMELDTIFMLNYYEDMDSVNVCFTGEDFENMYGHMLGEGHFGDMGMMGDRQNNESEWTHHLNDEHDEGDEHFGGFNMQNQTFDYQFSIMEDGVTHNMLFQGNK